MTRIRLDIGNGGKRREETAIDRANPNGEGKPPQPTPAKDEPADRDVDRES